MNRYFILVGVVFCFVFFNCSDKKETDAMGNAVESMDEVSVEATEPNTAQDLLIAQGQELFEGKGMCATCHKSDVKVIGPSIKEITKIYLEKGASIAVFINGEGKPLVDPSQYEIMKANFAITKAMTQEERDALEAYMMSIQ